MNSPSALDRARRDVENGDHWRARQRLDSYLDSKGYDPDLLRELGEIAYAMHDAFNAGRYWLLSSVEGEHVERAIEVFVSAGGKRPEQLAAQLPRRTRLPSIDGYAPQAQSRIERYKLGPAIVRAANLAAGRSASEKGSRIAKLIPLAIVAVLLLCCASCITGAVVIGRWMLGK